MFIGARARPWPIPRPPGATHRPWISGLSRAYPDRTEVEVHFTCVGGKLAGTLAIPPGPGRHPAAVWVHGSGEATRLTYSGATLVRELVHAGIAVLSYDKRGVADSTGQCCPGDDGHFNLLAADAAGALQAVAARPEIDPARVGFIGASQAGWVVPLAVSRLPPRRVHRPRRRPGGQPRPGAALLRADRRGRRACKRPIPTRHHRTCPRRRPLGLRPRTAPEAQRFPSLWLYGGQDRSQPTTLDLEVLTRLSAGNNRIKTIVFPEADHGLLDIPPSDPDALPTFVRWIQRTVDAGSGS